MRNWGIDLLRGIAAFGIVGCHLSLSSLTTGGESVLHFCDFNVAVFAVIAGLCMNAQTSNINRFTMLNLQSIVPVAYIIKRCKRILPVYLVWSLVYLVASLAFQFAGRGVEARFGDPWYWGCVVFRGNASCHLWFLIGLLYAQIVICVLESILEQMHRDTGDRSDNGFLTCGGVRSVFWMGLGIASVVWASYGGTWYHTYFLRLFGFLCVGYGLRGVVGRWKRNVTAGLAVLSGVALIGHVLLSGLVPSFIRDLIAVVPLVLLFHRLGETCAVTSNIPAILGSTSLAVFRVHPIITRIGSVVVGRVMSAPYSAGVVLTDWFVCWALAMGLALTVNRLPVVHYCVKRICRGH